MAETFRKWQGYDLQGYFMKDDKSDISEQELEEIAAFLMSKGILFAGSVKPFNFMETATTLSTDLNDD